MVKGGGTNLKEVGRRGGVTVVGLKLNAVLSIESTTQAIETSSTR